MTEETVTVTFRADNPLMMSGTFMEEAATFDRLTDGQTIDPPILVRKGDYVAFAKGDGVWQVGIYRTDVDGALTLYQKWEFSA